MCASGAAKLALFTHKQLIRPKPSLKTRGEDGYDHRIICFCVSDIGLVISTVENPHPQQQHGFKTELQERERECKSLQNKTFLWNFNDNLDIYFGMAQQGNTLLREREKYRKKASKWHGKLLLFHKKEKKNITHREEESPFVRIDQNLSPPKERNARPRKLRASARLQG